MKDYIKTLKKIIVYYITAHIGIIILILIGGVLLAGINQKKGLGNNKNLLPGVENIWLGIEAMEITAALAKKYNIHSSRGLLVTRVFKGSTAEAAGIMSGDILRRWNGKSILNHKQFQRYIQKTHTNKKIKFSIDRNGAPLRISAKLGMRPGNFK